MRQKCPCLFIHGKNDDIVLAKHSEELFEACTSQSLLAINETMTHNMILYNDHIVAHLKKFIDKMEIKLSDKNYFKFPREVYYKKESIEFENECIVKK